MTDDDLKSTASELVKETSELRKETVALRKGYGANRKLIRWTIAGLVLDITLTLVVGVLFHLVSNNSNHIQDVQTKVGNKVLCPLYQIFLNSYNPNSPTAKLDPKKYQAQFDVIRNSYKILNCK